MRNSIVVAVVAAGTMLVVSGNALACGESVFRVGKGVHYRAISAPIPGFVLVYARTDHERHVAENLSSAGHSVAVVASDKELAHEMQSQTYNVVVAPYSKREVIEEQSAQIASRLDWVPVVDSGSTDQRLARSEFDQVVTTDDDIRMYLKAIHKSLKKQGG